MTDEVTDITPLLLREIRDSIRDMAADLSSRIDATNQRLDATNGRLTSAVERLDRNHVELRAELRRSELRVTSVLVDMAGDISHIKDRLIGQEALESRMDTLEGEVASLKQHLQGSR